MVNKFRSVLNRGTFTLVTELIGISLVVIGVALWSAPAALVVAGLSLVAIGYLLE